MSEATSPLTPLPSRPPLRLERFDLDNLGDGLLMRLCAGFEQLRAIANEMERIAASLPACTPLRRRMKEMSL